MSLLSPPRHRRTVAALAAGVSALLALSTVSAAPAVGPSTPWTNDVSPSNALEEYPRPQLTRDRWKNLNGVWQFAGASPLERPPFGARLAERILVPYPTESALSGIQRHEDYMWYRKTILVPKGWRIGDGERLKLHFGAVDYQSKVYVNGIEVATHKGGYDSFTADITNEVTGSGLQEVIVGVEDRADATWQPVGKQRLTPDRGIFYTGASGIWQTVWIEPVARGFVKTLDMATDVDTNTLTLGVNTGGADSNLTAVARVKDGTTTVRTVSGPANQPLKVRVPGAKLWSPSSPFLYDLQVTLKRGNTMVDTAGSYFGMREIGTARGADGRMHITLNHKITFLMSTLDQGYWPDGIYTAPTDEALAFDLKEHKRLGFNTVRKHIKVEPDRWYYWADKLGLMVWQDMPAMKTSNETPPVAAQQQFEAELHEMVREHDSWTSIIGWIPFNEGWGEWDRQATGRIADEVGAQDPTRLVNAHSGVNCCASKGDSGRGNVIDWHQYLGPAAPIPTGSRVSIDGEHGGFGLEVENHMWYEDGGAYQMAQTPAELTRLYVQNQRQVLQTALQCGISGAIYTQITDVEHEVNGFFTYDRQVEKMDFRQVRAVNQAIVRNADGSGAPVSDDPGTPGIEGVHAYKFNEGTGTTAEDSQGDADATLSGPTGWGPGAEGTSAVTFDGGEADTGRSLVDTAGSYSVSAYAKLNEAGGAFQTVVSQDTGSASAFFLQYSGADQRWAFSFVGLRALSPTKPETGKWYHLVGVRDAQAGTIALYVDGQKVGQQDACYAPASTGTTVIGRGQFNGTKVDYLHGAIDDVRLFDRALTAEEVTQLNTPN